MGEGGSDGCEREPVCNGEGRGKEEGAVCLVGLKVERRIGVDDPRDVVSASRVIERV